MSIPLPFRKPSIRDHVRRDWIDERRREARIVVADVVHHSDHLIRLAWPAYTNEVVFLFHATALIYFTLPVIGDQKDLMNKAGELFERDYNAFLHYPVAALYFLAVSLCIFFVFGLVYRHLTRHMPGALPMKFGLQRWMQ